MGTRRRFSADFKAAIVSKVMARGKRTIAEICRNEGMEVGTVANWLRPRGSSSEMKNQKKSSKWPPDKKLKVLLETASLSEAELGSYLRKAGLFSLQLDEWKSEIISLMNSVPKSKFAKDERDIKIKSLEREILRKDKALAEASALLILQKKVNLIWGDNDEDEK